MWHWVVRNKIFEMHHDVHVFFFTRVPVTRINILFTSKCTHLQKAKHSNRRIKLHEPPSELVASHNLLSGSPYFRCS